MSAIFSCSKKSEMEDAKGDVQVQVGIQTSPTEYTLQRVTLLGIDNLREVSGAFAKFFYAPGSSDDQLTGSAPQAHFIRSSSFFVPSDIISMQMATIYYHMQNLADFDKQVGADRVNVWPRLVGLETQILDQNTSARRNNAFYNGQTDSMMFVPFTGADLPIAMNAGIIAHEHFHSLFYKVVIKPAANKKILANITSIHSEDSFSDMNLDARNQSPQVISEKEKALIFNETFLRGINEGLADFWGWVYTEDPEFMRWSLPTFQAKRSLTLNESEIGDYETEEKIFSEIDKMIQLTDNPKGALMNYSYEIGTPYARFLKQLTTQQAEIKKIKLSEAKIIIAQVVFNYINKLSEDVLKLEENQTIRPDSLFKYVGQLAQDKSQQIVFDQAECEFVAKYLYSGECKVQEDKSIIIVNP
jgi:hypothetical protein